MADSFNPLSLIASPITGAFQYAGAKKQADAATHAADLQSQAAQAALDYTKSVKAAQTNAAAPYLAVGAQAVGQLPGAVRPTPTGGPPAPYSVAPGTMPQGQQTGYSTLGQMGAPPSYGQAQAAPTGSYGAPNPNTTAPPTSNAPTAGMVMLQAPDGSTKSVAAALAPQYIARGAKVVG